MKTPTYTYRAVTITPLHIGSGERLREGFDFISHGKYLWIPHQGRLLGAILDEAAAESGKDLAEVAGAISEMTLTDLRKAGWLGQDIFQEEKQYFQYRLSGRTSTTNKAGEVHACIKDVYSRPYLPGSSLKGALRSILLRSRAEAEGQKPEIYYKQTRRGYDSRFAGQTMEKRHFMKSNDRRARLPNYDLWRAMQISDSDPVSAGNLLLATVRVFPTGGQGKQSIPIDIEAVGPQVMFSGTWRVDDWLFAQPAAQKLKFGPQEHRWLTTELPAIVRADTQARLAEEKAFLTALPDRYQTKSVKYALSLINFLNTEVKALPSNQMIFPVGKGTGWRSKTLGRALLERLPEREFINLVNKFNLGRGLWKPGGRIPLTRQLIDARVPLGWMRITLTSDE